VAVPLKWPHVRIPAYPRGYTGEVRQHWAPRARRCCPAQRRPMRQQDARAMARARRARAARREARPRGLSGEEARAAARPSGEDACAASAQGHDRYFPVRGNAINTAVSAIGRFGIHCLGSSRVRCRRARYRLPRTVMLPSARSARRVGCVVTGGDEAGTDLLGTDLLPSARSARRVGCVSAGSGHGGTGRVSIGHGAAHASGAGAPTAGSRYREVATGRDAAHASSASRRRQQVGCGKPVAARSVPVTTATKAVNAEPSDC
jgi:hypothetical protein